MKVMSRTALRIRRCNVVSSGIVPSKNAAMTSVVEFDGGLDQLLAVFLGLRLEVLRDLLVMELGAEAFVVPYDRLHADEVDDPPEVGFRTDRQLDADGTAADLGLDLVDATKEVGADLVQSC